MKFNEKLKRLREERDMNQVEFAALLGTTKQAISRYEKGNTTPRITVVAHYAEVLQVPLDYFVNDDIESVEDIKNPPTDADEIQSLVSMLSESKKQQLLLYARFLLSQEGR
jgi:transcriptional regulator with XRE-family HTH domain